MNSITDTLRALGVVRLVLMAAVVLGTGMGLYLMVARYSQPEMALLFADLDMADAGRIVSRIESLGEPVEVRGGGTQIYVPSDRVGRLRMEMAEAGLPRGGNVGYEIFDKQESLGTSSFVQDINQVRALEGELSRTIGSLNTVQAARVHLVLPRRELFSRDRQEPSASVVLRLNGPGRLKPAKVQAIQHLVAAAVPGLTPERVSVVDDQGNLLARGDSDTASYSAASLEDMRVGQEMRLAQTVEGLIEKYVGPGKVRAEATIEMDFDRITESTEKYDPDSAVVRSSQKSQESGNSKDAGGKEVTVANNLPDAQTQAAGGGSTSQTNKTDETLNYEISKTVMNRVREGGAIKRISVAVLVDGTYTKTEDGKQNYQPRPSEEMKKLEQLVKSAIGFQEDRNDRVEVLNMQFAPVDLGPEVAANEGFLGLTRNDLVRLAEVLIVGLIALLTLLLVVKPLFNKLLGSFDLKPKGGPGDLVPGMPGMAASYGDGMMRDANAPAPALGASEGMPALAGPQGASDSEEAIDPFEQMISLRQVEGQVRASSLKRIGEVIQGNPDEAATVIRSWMSEGKP
ncbi:MAG: flagellar basal-body MS-ring/collar protein FliF [Holosporales bacterium]